MLRTVKTDKKCSLTDNKCHVKLFIVGGIQSVFKCADMHTISVDHKLHSVDVV